jgi:hypothetical protein
MKRFQAHVLLVAIVVILCVSSFTSIQLANSATTYSSLSDALNATISNINLGSAPDSWTSTWGTILSSQSMSAFDSAMTQDINNGNYNDALFVARLASISGYSSATLTSGTQIALQNMAMEGSLPNNYNAKSYGDPNSGCYLVYDRYLIWAYQFAQQDGLTTKWNANQAFSDFAAMYNKPPIGSRSGEMLFCDPPGNWAYSYSSRYYDEHAETLSVFVNLAEIGVTGALTYADNAWNGLQTHWNGKYYVYTDGSSTIECEMGNFAQVIAEYAQLKGGVNNIPYWNRVLNDLDYKLLVNGWSSPGWSTPGVIVHAANGVNPEQRLWETMGVMTALQELYPYFNSTMQNSFDNLLTSGSAWKGLMSSNLNIGGFFKGASGDPAPSNDATICAAATMFLEGIVPGTGSLNIQIHNEQYQDHRTSFPVTDFQFNGPGNQITIPVNAGTITFLYGTAPVSYNFPSNGNYVIQFSSDWNTILSVNGQPVPTPTPTPSPTPSPTPTVTPTPTPTPTPTATPTPTPTPTATPTPTPLPTVTPTPTPKSLSESIKTSKSTYTRNSLVTITITVKDASNGALIKGASVAVNMKDPSGSTTMTSNGVTSYAGTVQFTYQLGHSPPHGIWTITSTASLNGYQNAVRQTTFTVT